MLIENATLAPWAIGHSNPELAPGKDGSWKPGQKVNTQLTVCIPGVNRLDDKFWASLQKNEDVKKRLKSRKIFVVTEKSGDQKKADELGIAQDFEGMDEKDAVEIVEKTLSKPLLDDWSRTDNRPRIQRAVNDQLDKLKLKPRG